MGVSNAASPMLHALTFRTYFLDLSVRCLLYLLSDSVPRCQVLGNHVPTTPKPVKKLIIRVGQVCTQAQRTGLPGLALSTREVLNP